MKRYFTSKDTEVPCKEPHSKQAFVPRMMGARSLGDVVVKLLDPGCKRRGLNPPRGQYFPFSSHPDNMNTIVWAYIFVPVQTSRQALWIV